MYRTHAPILDALRSRGFDQDRLSAAAAAADSSGRALHDVLVDGGMITELELAEGLALAYGLRTVELGGYPIDPAASARIPLGLARRHRVLGIAIEAGELVVAVADPGDVLALDDVRAASGLPVRAVVAARDELAKAIERMQRAENDLDDVAASLGVDASSTLMSALDSVGQEAPIVKYVNQLIERAVDHRASDLHLEPTEGDLRVRFRIDGVLHEIETVPKGIQSALISRLKIMAAIDITERRIPQNGRITLQLGARSVDLRAATLPTVWGEKVVLRILDTGGIDLDLKRLGFSAHNYERFSGSFAKPHGMLLVTGPTGSGKSTTLYATLTEISKPEVNIITVEDPVEYRLPGVNQVQVNPKAGLTFAAVLPAILRSDPDVVLIGEIRDSATAQLAIEASLTGHLVLSTLHTNDAPSAVTRLVEMGIEPFLVGSSLDCVMAQRLARRLCQWCKQEYAPTEHELTLARWPHETLGTPTRLWRPVGCRSCAGTGYRGRVALHEVMPVSEQIERLAVERASAHDIQRVALAEGMQTLRTDGLSKTFTGDTSLAEVLRVAV
ncbi:GspE/PulE family protein [uncultured Jatrophihabitans sp.]|uniref:GspE/PulE family protein n=1 Tax=uncultured Jatrophihabitans sp. TaxID=1610747 RepID=UPI0035CB0E34